MAFNVKSIIYRMNLCLTQRPIIRLAVIGGPSSGKTYLLQDFIHALRSLDIGDFECENPESVGRGFHLFSPSIYGEKGGVKQDPIYAGRQEDMWEATCIKNDSNKKFDITFVNIPGEVFRHAKIYEDLKTALIRRVQDKRFNIVEYKNKITGQTRQIVELKGRKLPSQEEIDNSSLPASRRLLYLDRTQICKDLAELEFKRTSSVSQIDGKTLLENMGKYDTDSVLESIFEVAPAIQIEDTFSKVDKDEMKASIFFLNYCKYATDIVVCERIFQPTNSDVEKPFSTGNLMDLISGFYSAEGQNPHAYLAYRGTDFLMQGKEQEYKKFIREQRKKGFTTTKIKNVVYSLFDYLTWNKIQAANAPMTSRLFQDMLGFEIEDISTDNKIASDSFINFKPKHDHFNIDNVSSHIKATLGTDGQGFDGLLKRAYPGIGLPFNELSNIPPHTYFTATPITADFDIFENKGTSGEFVKDGQDFSNMHSSFNFGFCQLCVDILSQHNINLGDDAMGTELLNYKRRTK